MNRLSGEESERRWNILLEREKKRAPSSAASTQQDPFDCSALGVPPSQTLVDNVLRDSAERWKDLEDRKVQTVAVSNEEGEEDSSRKRKRADGTIGWGWHANRLRLPENFDYETRQPMPPEDDAGGDRVVSLEDPSVHLSFERELWKLFRSVPTLEELEEEAMSGAKCQRMRHLHDEIAKGLQKHTRLDCHALSRLRMSDRHGLPSAKGTSLVTTIRLECWRRHLKRGSSPDGYRLELEFLASQTLKDVHDAICELSMDELWTSSDNGDSENAAPSGMFLIEGVFFTAGSVDYATPIIKWLGDSSSHPLRRTFLGLPVNEPLVFKPMSEARLEQLKWRTGVRYCHSHHGDVECSVFLTDIRRCYKTPYSSYPVIHDVWTPVYPFIECEACHHRVGVLSTSANNEVTDGGPRALCESCYLQLHPSNEQPSNVQKYSIWRDQVDLSVENDSPDAPFQIPSR